MPHQSGYRNVIFITTKTNPNQRKKKFGSSSLVISLPFSSRGPCSPCPSPFPAWAAPQASSPYLEHSGGIYFAKYYGPGGGQGGMGMENQLRLNVCMLAPDPPLTRLPNDVLNGNSCLQLCCCCCDENGRCVKNNKNALKSDILLYVSVLR